MADMQIINGDCLDVLKNLPPKSVQTCVTSPPYFGLRDYGHDGQIGLEETPEEYVQKMVEVFRGVRDALRDDGTLWLNLGDSYSSGGRGGGAEGSIQSGNKGSTTGQVFNPWKVPGFRPKNLIGIPWRVALALQADGWYLRQDIIWHKPNPMPESVKDRCTKAHEYIFLMSKRPRYYFDADAIAEKAKWERWGDQTEKKSHPGTAGHLGGKAISELPIKDTKNKRSVWAVNTKPYAEAHFATFPPELITPCILAGSREGDTVLDPFNGSGTTGLVSLQNRRKYIGIELNPDYVELTHRRLSEIQVEMFV